MTVFVELNDQGRTCLCFGMARRRGRSQQNSFVNLIFFYKKLYKLNVTLSLASSVSKFPTASSVRELEFHCSHMFRYYILICILKMIFLGRILKEYIDSEREPKEV